MSEISQLTRSIQIGSVTAGSRVVIQAMEGCDGGYDGSISLLTKRRYMRFARSGAGILWFEATAVCAEGRANPRQLFLTPENKEGYRQLLSLVREESRRLFGYAPIIILQATHSGRYAKPTGTPQPIVAYRNELFERGREDFEYTVATDEYLSSLVDCYAQTARLAAEVGFDGLDVKCCHGYLLDELLSAFSRQGIYGGSFENRTRLYFDCLRAVQSVSSPDFLVTSRLNMIDGFPYGYGYGVNERGEDDLDEATQIIDRLRNMGVQLVNLTLGNPYLIPNVNRPTDTGGNDGEAGYRRIQRLTAHLKAAFPDMTIISSGMSYAGAECISRAEECIASGTADMVGFGRMAFAYPTFFADTLRGEFSASRCCIKCAKCTELMRSGSATGCPVRDSRAYLPLYRERIMGETRLNAVVTGGSRGIGFAVARALVENGYRVLVTARHVSTQLEELCEQYGESIRYLTCDIADTDSAAHICECIVREFGSVDLLVNSAGIAPPVRCDMMDLTPHDYDVVMDVNCRGTFFVTQGIARLMSARRAGRIVNISSVSADMASVNRAAYCISKAGISMQTKLFATELASDGITVFEIRPGIIDTDMTAGVMAKYETLIREGLTCTPRAGTPQDVADVVLAIAGARLDYCTGTVIYADGGLHVGRL